MSDIFKREITFGDAYTQFNKGVLLGIIQGDTIILNPNKETKIANNDKLIAILKHRLDYYTSVAKKHDTKLISIAHPLRKASRKICILGDYDDICVEEIVEFLTLESVEKFKKIVLQDDNYIVDDFWDTMVTENYDVIILNIDDNDEFILTMYLRNRYRGNDKLLNSIVNIIHEPVDAKLLIDDSSMRNIILSEKIVGEYITQVMFNQQIVPIFDEITQPSGNELYILEKHSYQALFEMNYDELKLNLFHNEMLYVGAIMGDYFMVNCQKIKDVEKIVIMSKGANEWAD